MNYRIGKHYRLIVDPSPRKWWKETDTHNYDLFDRNGYEIDHGEIPAAALPIGSERLKKILNSAFCIRGHGGYPALFIASGCELVCVECGISELIESWQDDIGASDGNLEYHVDDAYHDRPTGESCSWCNEWIFEPFCAECGTNQSELAEPHRMTGNRLEYSDDGGHCVCRQCIHDALLRTRGSDRDPFHDYQPEHRTHATVVAPQTYELSNCWFAGIYGRGV